MVTALEPKKNMIVKYKITEKGAFVEIFNWEEISKIMNTIFDIILADKIYKDEKVKAILEPLEPL